MSRIGKVQVSAQAGGQVEIAVNGLSYGADGQRLLQIEALRIASPGPTVILGPNGAGKSLFLRLLHGLIAPDSGSIRLSGRGGGAGPRQAMVFQKPVLLRRSVAANVNYALKVQGVLRAGRKDRVRHFLEMGGLLERARQQARTLSGGEQQRLALVRALAGQPEILFMDEPTSSLDPNASLALEELIEKTVANGTKVVMVTHDLGLARRLADDVLFLHQGQLCEQTPAQDFFETPQSAEARAFLARNLVI